MCKMVENLEFNGIELYFDNIPAEKIREKLKEYNFRWHRVKKCWFAKKTDERLRVIKDLNLLNGNNTGEKVIGTEKSQLSRCKSW